MNKTKIAYYILILIGAVELGRGLQLIINPLFWSIFYPYTRLTLLLQVIISALLFFAAIVLKPKVNGKSI
jgi:hypothetical protein